MEAIGLTLEGEELRLARVRKRRGRLEILGLESVHLADTGNGSEARTEDSHYREVMGLLEAEEGEMDGGAVAALTATAVAEKPPDPVSRAERTLHNTLLRHSGKGVRLGLALDQGEVTFAAVGYPQALPRRQLRRHVRAELAALDPALTDDAFDFVPRGEHSALAFSHDGAMALLERVRRVNDTLPDPLRLALVDVTEVALMNLLVRLTAPSPGMTVLVFVGSEFTRLLFFRDGRLHDLSPVIHEGVSARGNLSQCYGRIVAELDVAGVDAVESIYVAGAADIDEYRAFFEERLPGCRVQDLPYCDVFEGDPDMLGEAGAYALPISLAWKVLDGRRAGFTRSNFLPADLRRGWLAMALAWHGWALLSCCAVSLVASGAAAALIQHAAHQARSDLELAEAGIAAVTPATQAVDELGHRIGMVREQSALVDSLRPATVSAAHLVGQLAATIEELNSTWVTDLSLADGAFSVQGISLYGNRIPRLAESQSEARIHSVALTSIMDKALYEYDVSGPVPAAAAATPTTQEATP